MIPSKILPSLNNVIASPKESNSAFTFSNCFTIISLNTVSIGDNTVIGIGSTVNKSIPSGSLAAGSPCRVIKENYYPKNLTESEKENIVCGILGDWYTLHETKGINVKSKYVDGQIILIQGDNQTIYDVNEKIMCGYENDVSEDLRDYLRRRGIKIFTDKPFRSIWNS